MVKVEYIENGITKSISFDSDDIMDTVKAFKECTRAKIEHGDITYISASIEEI